MPADPTRRALLLQALAGAAFGLAPRPARAFGAGTQFRIAEIMLGSGTVSRPEAWKRLLFEVIQSTSVGCDPTPVQLGPEDPALFEHPFSVIIANGTLPELSDVAAEQLVRYLSYGGFLVIDDATGTPDGTVARSVQALTQRLFPTRPLSPLPGDHSIFRSFFLLDRALGRTDRASTLEGITVGPISPLIFCGNDLSGALDRGPDGRNRYPVTPGGEYQRREAIKLGVNLVLYALTSNYKHDIAHVIELMQDGRLE